MVLERIINLESLQWWLQFGLAVISFAGAVGGVLMWLLKRYRKTLKDAQGYKVITVDGDFGAVTDKAVREYQAGHGLVVDGIVGEQTWGKLER